MATEAALVGATSDDIAAARDVVVAYLQDRFPRLAIRGGQLSDLVVLPAADALSAVDVRSTELINSADPEVALSTGVYNPDVLNAVLAGRGVTRIPASVASGSIAIHLSSVNNTTVPASYQVRTADGVFYGTTGSFQILAVGSTAISTSQVVAVSVPGGGFAVTIPVSATVTGAAGNRPAGTALTAQTALPAQTAVYAATDLSGGADAETDAALLLRLSAATAARTVASSVGAAGVVEAAYPAYSAVATIGFGNPGMLRGRTGLTGQSPGRVDVRVRTADQPSRVRVPVTATLIGTAPFGHWRFALGADDAPGRFLIEKVIQRNAALTVPGYAPAVTQGFDVTSAAAPVDIRISDDAVLSTYSTASVTFFDNDTSTSGLVVNVSTRSYDAIVRTVPGLDVAQSAVELDTNRASGGDCLVRAACPVMVALTAVASVAAGVALTSAQVATAVATAINQNGQSQTVSASSVAARAATILPGGTSLQLTAWTGTVYPVMVAAYAVTGVSGLSVPTDWSIGVGPGAVAFYADPESTTASVVTAT